MIRNGCNFPVFIAGQVNICFMPEWDSMGDAMWTPPRPLVYELIESSDIKAAYEEKVGHSIGSGQIYYTLKRHGWRKIKPRRRHPKKASAKVIEASKKLTFESEK